MSKQEHGKPKEQGHTNGQTKAKAVQHVSWFWPLISGSCMVVVTLWVYWAWICVEFNQGKMLLPKSIALDDVAYWWQHDIWARIVTHAQPTLRAWTVYLSWVLLQALLFAFAPGPTGKGVKMEDGRQLTYKYNGQFAFFTTLALVAGLHTSGVFPLTELYRLFPNMLTVCNLYTAIIILLIDLYARATNTRERMTDSIIYDYFMGAQINPMLFGWFDIKFFHELRPGIMQWFFTTIGLAIMQYRDYGTVSTPMMLVCFYHLCFVNACYKGEQCVPYTIDIVYEKFGWMLCMLDLVMVPFVFPLQAYYLYKIGPMEHSVAYTVAVAAMHILGYWMFDTANSQKDYFREKPGEEIPKGFPQLPWDRLKNPKYLQTERGTKLLLDGWWKYARHMNYTGDIMMSWAWGLTCGTGSYFPFCYTTYLTPLLLHRERRDDRDCRRKYGKDWDKYCKEVPYRLIPYIY